LRPDAQAQAPLAYAGDGREIAPDLARRISCARCNYDLRGLSITARCPECGTPVRASLLAVLDPLAHELRPVPRPGLTAAGLTLWVSGALLASLVVWVLRVSELTGVWPAWRTQAGMAVAALALLSGVGALALVKPHEGLPRRGRVLAAVGAGLYVPLAWRLWRLHAGFDAGFYPAYQFGDGEAASERSWLRLSCGALIAAVIVCLRPNARLLASRSFVMRTGRVDRQTMAALAAVVAVWSIGDALVIGATAWGGVYAEELRMFGDLFILVGSAMFTVGLVGVAVDVWRLRGVILEPPLTLSEVTGGRSA